MRATEEQRQQRIWLIPTLVLGLACYNVLVDVFSLQPLMWLDQERPIEIWRIITAQILHTDTSHLLWNLAALALLGGYLECNSVDARRIVGSGLAYGFAGIALWFYLAAPTQLYCGLSGALNALMVIVLNDLLVRARRLRDRAALTIVLALAFLYLLKLFVELTSAHRLVGAGDWPSAPGAHAAGLLAGLAWLLVARRRANPTSKQAGVAG